MGLRRALLISSNNRTDRDGEIVSAEALQGYVKACHDDEGRYIGKNVLLMWHGGEPIGKITECQFVDGFLVELAEELSDAVVNLGDGDEVIEVSIKQAWDYIEAHQVELGVSQGFKYMPDDLQDGVYKRIIKLESSILPIEYASNPFTLVKVVDKSV